MCLIIPQSGHTETWLKFSKIVDFVISSLFSRHYRPQHILAHGFERISAQWLTTHDIGALASSIPGVTKQFPNSNVQALKTAPWTEILGLLGKNGDMIMMRLLLDCGIFVCLDQGRALYYQLSGMITP